MVSQNLRSGTAGVLIVAHHEQTDELRDAFATEGLEATEVRGPYTPRQLQYSRVMQCLVNHANAWKLAASRALPTIVVEGDFVPVRGFGSMPMPPLECADGLVYLYACGPQFWDLAAPGWARGHAGGMQALLVTPAIANVLLRFFEMEIAEAKRAEYRPWDTYLGFWLNERSIECFIPYRHYGEHGGMPNPEHAAAGLPRPHRADALAGPLLFRPTYASSVGSGYWRVRAAARCWGVVRLFAGRSLAWRDFVRARSRPAIIRFVAGRLLFSAPPQERK